MAGLAGQVWPRARLGPRPRARYRSFAQPPLYGDPPLNMPRRVLDLLAAPRAAFTEIGRERAGPGEILRDHVLPLAAMAPLAAVVASLRGGVAALPRAALAGALDLGTTVLGLGAVALAASLSAPLFGGERDGAQGFRLVAFASTPAWLAALAGTIPGLEPLKALSLWSLVLVYIGLPRLMYCAEGPPRLAYAALLALAMALAALLAGQLRPA